MFNVKKIELISKLLTNYYGDSHLQCSSLPTCEWSFRSSKALCLGLWFSNIHPFFVFTKIKLE